MIRQQTDQSAPYNELALRALGVPPSSDTRSGSGGRVVIGFVDYGFDLLHPCLLDAAGTSTRFKFLWDQNLTPELVRQVHLPPSAMHDYPADVLNQLIAASSKDDRSPLDAAYDPHAYYYGRSGVTDGAHGTMMASIAAGTPHMGFRSPAPFADLIGVQLAVADTDWREETTAGEPTWRHWSPDSGPWNGWRTYDGCPQIVHAIRYIYERASRMSAELVIINLSIGTWAGAHDGRSPVEQAIADVIRHGSRPGATACRVVIGTGNAGADQGHFAAKLETNETNVFQWVMNRADTSQNKLEIWYDGGPLTVSLSDPQGSPSLPINPGPPHPVTLGDRHVGMADHVTNARGALSRVRILLHPPYFAKPAAADGEHVVWTLTLSNVAAVPVKVHAWVERDDGLVERSWLVPHHRESTLCCLATAAGAVVVSGSNHHTADGKLRPIAFSGEGPAPWTNIPAAEAVSGTAARPMAAPAHGIWGAQSKTAGFTTTSGTSAAAALVSGALAAEYVQLRNAADTSQSRARALAATEP
jgi:Subtilase family